MHTSHSDICLLMDCICSNTVMPIAWQVGIGPGAAGDQAAGGEVTRSLPTGGSRAPIQSSHTGPSKASALHIILWQSCHHLLVCLDCLLPPANTLQWLACALTHSSSLPGRYTFCSVHRETCSARNSIRHWD